MRALDGFAKHQPVKGTKLNLPGSRILGVMFPEGKHPSLDTENVKSGMKVAQFPGAASAGRKNVPGADDMVCIRGLSLRSSARRHAVADSSARQGVEVEAQSRGGAAGQCGWDETRVRDSRFVRQRQPRLQLHPRLSH